MSLGEEQENQTDGIKFSSTKEMEGKMIFTKEARKPNRRSRVLFYRKDGRGNDL